MKMKNKRKLLNLKVFLLLILSVAVVSSVEAQNKLKKQVEKNALCKIGTTEFKCPNDFKQEQIVDKETILYKYQNEDTTIYFFISIPSKNFDDAAVRNLISAKISGRTSDVFRWKELEEPFVMSLESKYETKIVGQLGYNRKLVNFVSRYFDFNGKIIVLGYGYDTKNDGAKEMFERGDSIGDQAIGCNAIAATLNSITKEKKGDLQHCFIRIKTAE